jgi:glycosyltransferase involved in cell wall biosynthesis
MKILVVHQYYLLPDHPGGSRFNEFARLWTEAGHQVTVIAGALDYATGNVPSKYKGRWLVREMDGQVTVLRCHVPATYTKSYPGRMWAFLGFTLSSMSAVFRAERPDVIVTSSPPLIAAFPGWLASHAVFRSTPWVFEVRDLWPESAVSTGVLSKDAALTRLLFAVERWAYREADRINVLTPAFRENIVGRGLAADARIVFVPNGADVEQFKPGSRDNNARHDLGWGTRTVAMYAGAHGRANAIGQLVEAAAHLRDRPDLLIACVGDGPERSAHEAEAKRLGLSNIVFHGAQPKARMPEIVNACDIGVAVLQKNPTFRTVYPNKVFDYMACARPTLVAIDGIARKLVCEEACAGLFAEPENGEALAHAIVQLAGSAEMRAEMGRNGRRWVLANATRESLAKRYLQIMEDMVAESAGAKHSGALLPGSGARDGS